MTLHRGTLAMTPFLFFAMAVAEVNPMSETQLVKVLYQEVNSAVSIEVYSKDVVIEQACSNIISSGVFATLPISFDVDLDGNGNITVGSSTYLIHESEELSGGISCGRMYSATEAAVSCIVPVPADLPLEPLAKRDQAVCFPDGQSSAAQVLKMMDDPSVNFIATSVDGEIQESEIVKRQGCYDRRWTEKIGDGNPHQNYFHSQLSENIFCGAAQSCTAGYQVSRSLTIGFSVTSGKQASEWISGGFSVQASWTTGNNYACTAGSGQTVCIWYNTAHTAYTVKNGLQNTCSLISSYSDPFVMFSPNNNNVGGGYYCVVGAQYCRSSGQGYWDYNGRAGGP